MTSNIAHRDSDEATEKSPVCSSLERYWPMYLFGKWRQPKAARYHRSLSLKKNIVIIVKKSTMSDFGTGRWTKSVKRYQKTTAALIQENRSCFDHPTGLWGFNSPISSPPPLFHVYEIYMDSELLRVFSASKTSLLLVIIHGQVPCCWMMGCKTLVRIWGIFLSCNRVAMFFQALIELPPLFFPQATSSTPHTPGAVLTTRDLGFISGNCGNRQNGKAVTVTRIFRTFWQVAFRL